MKNSCYFEPWTTNQSLFSKALKLMLLMTKNVTRHKKNYQSMWRLPKKLWWNYITCSAILIDVCYILFLILFFSFWFMIFNHQIYSILLFFILVMILGVLLARKKYPLMKYICVLLIVIGVALFFYKDVGLIITAYNNGRSSLCRRDFSEHFQPIQLKMLWKVSLPLFRPLF